MNARMGLAASSNACADVICLAMYGWSAFVSIFSHTGAMMK